MMPWIFAYCLAGALFVAIAHLTAPPSKEPNVAEIMDAIEYPHGKPWWLKLVEGLAMAFVMLLLAAVWPVVLPWWIHERLKPAPPKRVKLPVVDDTPRFRAGAKNLVESMTLDAIEAREHVEDPLVAVPAIPFGHLNPAWEAFKAGLLPGDEIWSFVAPADEARRQWITVRGYAALREGEIVAEMISDGG